jgi:hypothetical protein
LLDKDGADALETEAGFKHLNLSAIPSMIDFHPPKS